SFSNCDQSKHCEFCGQFVGSLASPAAGLRFRYVLAIIAELIVCKWRVLTKFSTHAILLLRFDLAT
ncbi:MAG: hypothetical protein NC828_06615, partial [Candidatus Omnitrophica bacterium]|nr:hypothetical protein [Candidatus Omnitrophota bacterium]